MLSIRHSPSPIPTVILSEVLARKEESHGYGDEHFSLQRTTLPTKVAHSQMARDNFMFRLFLRRRVLHLTQPSPEGEGLFLNRVVNY